jgi:radical SAM protein (TIGR01212 family)
MVYFQPYSNTHAPLEELRQLYEEALQVPDVIGLTIGTRPDCVDEAKLDYLAELGRQFDVTIEYGLESISDTTLQRINRGHDVKSYETAMRMSAERGLKTCTHIIIGFPWEEEAQWLETAAYLSEQKTTFLKVHQLHVVKNTAMAKEYQRMPFHVFGYEEYRQFLLKFIARLSPEIVLQRLAGEAPPNILIAPKWNVQMGSFIKDFRELCRQENIWQGKDYKP